MKVLSVLFLINVIHGCFLTFILMSKIKRQNRSSIFLMILITIISMYQVKAIIVLEGYYDAFPFLMNFFLPFHFLLGPLFFFYIKFAANKKEQLVPKDVLHLVPALLCFFSLLPFYMKSSAEKLALHSAPAPGNFEIDSYKFLYYGPILISIFYYCWASWKFVGAIDKRVDGRAKDYLLTLQWLRKYTSVFLIFVCCLLLAQLIFIFTDFYQFYVMLSTVFASSILIHYIAYWAIKESKVMSAIQASHKNSNSVLVEERVVATKENIIHILEQEKLFLNNGLSAKDFCERLQINSQYLSKIINSEFNCNLSYLVNSYRIDHAKNLIASGDYDHLNFLGIAQMSGFNSANAFTRVFKQHVGQTPSQFKKANCFQ